MVIHHTPLSINAADLRRGDRDRFVLALFAPADRREALIALYLLDNVLARVSWRINEPLLAEIRLRWWRDGLAATRAGERVGHPVLDALAPVLGALSWSAIDRLLTAREHELRGAAILADRVAFEDFLDGLGASVVSLALEILGVTEDAAIQAGRHVGIAWALVELLRKTRLSLSQGRTPLPEFLLTEHSVKRAAGLLGTPPSDLSVVARDLVEMARIHLIQAREWRPARPRAGFAALAGARLAKGYLDRLTANGFNLMNTEWSVNKVNPLIFLLLFWCQRY